MHLARLQLPGRSATISRGIDSPLLSFVHRIAEQAKRVSARTRACTRVHARVTSVTNTRGSPLGWTRTADSGSFATALYTSMSRLATTFVRSQILSTVYFMAIIIICWITGKNDIPRRTDVRQIDIKFYNLQRLAIRILYRNSLMTIACKVGNVDKGLRGSKIRHFVEIFNFIIVAQIGELFRNELLFSSLSFYRF